MEQQTVSTFQINGTRFNEKGEPVLLEGIEEFKLKIINEDAFSARPSTKEWSNLKDITQTILQRLRNRPSGSYSVCASYRPVGEKSIRTTRWLFKISKHEETYLIQENWSEVEIAKVNLATRHVSGVHDARPFFEKLLPSTPKMPSKYEAYGLKRIQMAPGVREKEKLKAEIESVLKLVPLYIDPTQFSPVRALYVRLDSKKRRERSRGHYRFETQTVTLYAYETGNWGPTLAYTWLHEYWHHLQACRRTSFLMKTSEGKNAEYEALVEEFHQQLDQGETVRFIREIIR